MWKMKWRRTIDTKKNIPVRKLLSSRIFCKFQNLETADRIDNPMVDSESAL